MLTALLIVTFGCSSEAHEPTLGNDELAAIQKYDIVEVKNHRYDAIIMSSHLQRDSVHFVFVIRYSTDSRTEIEGYEVTRVIKDGSKEWVERIKSFIRF